MVLTIVERITRKYLAIKIDGKTASVVSTAIQSLKKYYGDKFSQIFKTIISDNGSEFTELTKLENNTMTKEYFVHPYSSQERCSDKYHNGLLRRFIYKGNKIYKYTSDDILLQLLNELFENELDNIYAV